MTRKILLVLIIGWGLPFLAAMPGGLEVLCGHALAQDDPPGFLDKLKSLLLKRDDASRSNESVTDRYDMLYELIHQEEKALYDSLSKLGVSNWDRYQNIITLETRTVRDSIRTSLLPRNLKVFGWHPYWMGSAYQNYRFELLSHLAWFCYNIDPATGAYNNPGAISIWNASDDMITAAHQAGCKVLITITNHTETGNLAFLTNERAQQTLIDSLVVLLRNKNGDGVDVNFENIRDGLEEELTLFLTKLSNGLKTANKDYILTVDLPIEDYKRNYELDKLDGVVDLFLVTGYDYHNGQSRTDGPVAPLDAPAGAHSIKRSVNRYLKAGLKREKLVLGLPYYGAVWTGETGRSRHADSTLRFGGHMTYRAMMAKYCTEQPRFDTLSYSRYYIVADTASGTFEKAWMDDSLTLARKFRWIREQGLAGAGIWALGYDNGYNELWNMIDTLYGADTTLVYADMDALVQKYQLPRSLAAYRPLIAIAGIFITAFLVLGLFVAMFSWQVREVFFQNKTLRLLYSFAGVATLLSVYAFYLYVSGQTVLSSDFMTLGVGLLLGVCLTLVVSYFYEKHRRSLP